MHKNLAKPRVCCQQSDSDCGGILYAGESKAAGGATPRVDANVLVYFSLQVFADSP